MTTYDLSVPPSGTRLHVDTLIRGSRIRARMRWTDPLSRERRSRSVTVDNDIAAQDFFELMRTSSTRIVNPLITLNDYARSIGDRYLRGVDPTSTAGGYRAGLRLRVLPRLGHMRVREITTGLVDRAIDNWEPAYSRSTLKGTIAALTRVLDEAVRDDLIARNPVRDRANRRYHQNTELQRARPVPSPDEVARIAGACAVIHQSYGDHIVLSAFLAARCSEVAGLIVGDVDWASKLVTIERQCFPGAGGLSIKPPKGVEFAAFRSSSHSSQCCAGSRRNGRATCRCCVGRAAVSSPPQRCVMQPAGIRWLHHWACRGCAVTTFGTRVQPGSQTPGSRSMSWATSSGTHPSRQHVHTYTLATPRCGTLQNA